MKIAVVHNWPGQRNSELELFKRIAHIARALGHQCLLVDPLGHPLTENGEHYTEPAFVNFREIDFCLSLHYLNPAFFDTFSYGVNWNPLKYVINNPIDGSILPIEDVNYRTCCLASHDVLLSAGSEELDDFVSALQSTNPCQVIEKTLCLHTTSETVHGLNFPDFSDFKIFYIGANWERQGGRKRHNGLIEQLDETGMVEFYGVARQHGIYLWEGIKNYKGELPFDGGKSIVSKSNECGVSLVLHSQAHRDSGLASTRIFQACAAKTLTICDDNPFILKYFGDSVLSFPYDKNVDENVNRIKALIEWIKTHPDEALTKAKKAYKIFSDNFTLQSEIKALLERHPQTVSRYIDKYGASNQNIRVDVLFIFRGNHIALENFFGDMINQVRINPRAIIYCRDKDKQIVKNSAKNYLSLDVTIKSRGKRDCLKAGLVVTQYLQGYDSANFFTVYSPSCRWHKFHLTRLVAALENRDALIAQAAIFVKNTEFLKLLDEYYFHTKLSINSYPKSVTIQDIGTFAADKFPSGMFLFKTDKLQHDSLLSSLQFFDAGWALFVISWHYCKTMSLPTLVPKFSVEFRREDKKWHVDAYHKDAHFEKNMEQALAYSFLYRHERYISIMQENCMGIKPVSRHEKMIERLKNKPLLLLIYRFFLGMYCKILRLPSPPS